MQVFSLEAVALSWLQVGMGGTMHWLCKLRQQISDAGSSKQTKLGFSFACLLVLGAGGKGDSEDRKCFSAFVKGPFRLVSCLFKNTVIIHVHEGDINTYVIQLKKTQGSLNRALCSATDTDILDCKCNSSVWIKHLYKASTSSTMVKAGAFLQPTRASTAVKSFLSYPSKYLWTLFLGEERQICSQSQLHAWQLCCHSRELLEMVMVCQMGTCQGWQRPPSLCTITKEPSK